MNTAIFVGSLGGYLTRHIYIRKKLLMMISLDGKILARHVNGLAILLTNIKSDSITSAMTTETTKNANTQIHEILKEVQKEYRVWGYYRVLGDFNEVKVKELVISPSMCLSFQKHEHRDEFWCVNSGVARVILSEDYPRGSKKVEQDLIEDKSTTVILHETETLVIPAGTWHQLINPSRQELSIVEVQYGEQCDEEDITRLYQ
jgi:mannose-6-phosphate isomerase-like protein (cupin superfamily)